MVLNMARDDVKEYIFGVLDKLVTENNIRYFKWDMNRRFSEPGWPEAGPADEQKALGASTCATCTRSSTACAPSIPSLEIESCSGGGGRVDLGILQRVDEVWTSDNTEAFDRLRIQEGFSQAYPRQGDVGLGDRRSQHERAQHAAEVPFPGGHAGRAGDRRQPEPLDRRTIPRWPRKWSRCTSGSAPRCSWAISTGCFRRAKAM